MKISLCLVVWNELQGCLLDVPKLPLDAFDEVYAIDGGSTDGTVEYLQSYGIVVHRQPKKGLNAAYVHANDMSTCDAVVAFFPKATTPTEALMKFRFLFEQGNELVIASRQVAGANNEEDSGIWRPRKWAVRGLALMAALVWRSEGYWVRDVLHGFKGWTRSAFSRMKILDYGLSIDIEMVVRAYKLKIKRTEFPIIETARKHGDTHFKIWPTGKKFLAYLWYEIHRVD
jgi:glycosyltransferase involved in cell wall biosynthesis